MSLYTLQAVAPRRPPRRRSQPGLEQGSQPTVSLYTLQAVAAAAPAPQEVAARA